MTTQHATIAHVASTHALWLHDMIIIISAALTCAYEQTMHHCYTWHPWADHVQHARCM